MKVPAFFRQAITLETSQGRVLVFTCLSIAVFFSKYHWLDHLSIWGDIGIKWAPSIGLTRAYWLLLHGQPHAAYHRNPLIYVVLLIGLPLVLRDCFITIRSRRHKEAIAN